MSHPSAQWARRYAGQCPDPAVRLFCFPYAGAGASVYRDWRLPRTDAEVWAVQPPGRENRTGEPPIRRIEPLLEGYAAGLGHLLDRPFAFFGHSLGALVAFELTRLMRRRGGPRPAYLFLSARRAPGRPAKRGPVSGLAQEEFLARLSAMAGSSQSVVRDRELLIALAPLMRADFEVCETYRYRPERPIDVPVRCYAADDDSEVDPDDVAAWRDYTTGRCDLRLFTGGHLFLRDHGRQLMADVAAALADIPPSLATPGSRRVLPQYLR